MEQDDSEEAASEPIVKRRKGCQHYPEQNKDEQAISESSLNRLVGAVEVYDLEVEQFDSLSFYIQNLEDGMVWEVTKLFVFNPFP